MSMMGVPPGYGLRVTLLASTVAAGVVALTNPLITYDGQGKATVPVGAVQGLQRFSMVQANLRVTVASTLVGDTLDVYIDTTAWPKSQAGVVARDWVNVVHFPQVLGNGGVKDFVATMNNQGGINATPTDVTADAAANVVRTLILGDSLRVRYVTAGTGSFTFQVDAYAQ